MSASTEYVRSDLIIHIIASKIVIILLRNCMLSFFIQAAGSLYFIFSITHILLIMPSIMNGANTANSTANPLMQSVLNLNINADIIGDVLSYSQIFNIHANLCGVIGYIKDRVFDVVDHGLQQRKIRTRSVHMHFSAFIKKIIEQSDISMGTMLTLLIYLHKAEAITDVKPSFTYGEESILLGALILSAKACFLFEAHR